MRGTQKTDWQMEVAENGASLTRAQLKYQKRKAKQHEKKLMKKNAGEGREVVAPKADNAIANPVQVEYVVADPMAGLDESDPDYQEFAEIFRRFDMISKGISPDKVEKEELESETKEEDAADVKENESDSKVEENVPKKLSKRQKRLARRVDIADLKEAAKRADLVEIQDTTAADPFLLVHLKAYRNSIPVPRHWGQKKKYLQGKRGMEKIAYQLPDFIRNTGIAELRQAALDRADQQKLKAKQRERLRPKMGQLDVDYQVLNDAFFRYQTKPSLTTHGELYYESKEYEPKTKDFVAGVLSENLKKALGMPENSPPPWLPQMQMYGPPPSYPGLRVPGVNAPIPIGAKYGFHIGGWGRAPIDAAGRPIWGWADVRTAHSIGIGGENDYEPSFQWGAMLYADDYEDTLEDEEDEEDTATTAMQVDQQSNPTRPNGEDKSLDTDDSGLNLRKNQRSANEPVDPSRAPTELYQVLQQQSASVGSAAMGSQHTYVVPPSSGARRTLSFLGNGGLKAGELEITLDPSDFELSEDQLRQKYEQLYRDHERQQLQPQGAQLSSAEKDEMMRRSMVSKDKKDNTKDKKKKDYVKF